MLEAVFVEEFKKIRGWLSSSKYGSWYSGCLLVREVEKLHGKLALVNRDGIHACVIFSGMEYDITPSDIALTIGQNATSPSGAFHTKKFSARKTQVKKCSRLHLELLKRQSQFANPNFSLKEESSLRNLDLVFGQDTEFTYPDTIPTNHPACWLVLHATVADIEHTVLSCYNTTLRLVRS
jgi:hypothetical protein